MRKRLMALILTSAMAVSLAACGGGGQQAADTTAAPAADATTAAPAADSSQSDAEAPAGDGGSLVYWSMWEATEPQGQAIQAAVDQFTATSCSLQIMGPEV